MLDELQRYENIVDDHVIFELAEEKKSILMVKKDNYNLLRKRKLMIPLKRKILDIERIRNLLPGMKAGP